MFVLFVTYIVTSFQLRSLKDDSNRIFRTIFNVETIGYNKLINLVAIYVYKIYLHQQTGLQHYKSIYPLKIHLLI